jgi:hypothetical protein
MDGSVHVLHARTVKVAPSSFSWRQSCQSGRRSGLHFELRRDEDVWWVRGWDTPAALELRARAALLA